jgi:hypothetical protein
MAESDASRYVRFPPGYVPPGTDTTELLPWSWVEERLVAAPNYWIATVSPSGRPHVRPVDGVWVEDALCFGGAPEAAWARNLTTNPAISVNLASYNDAVILEGRAELITDQSHPLAAPSSAALHKKYPQYYSGDAQPFQPFWLMRPTTAYAWALDTFPKGAARWTFAV